jgi:aminopeptidase
LIKEVFMMMQDKLFPLIEKLYKVNFAVRQGEKILVFTDLIRDDENISEKDRLRRESLRETARLVSQVGEKFGPCVFCEYEAPECSGIEPPEEIWKRAFGENILEELKKENLFSGLLAKNLHPDQVKKVDDIVASHKDETVDIVVALSNFSTSHTKFRDLLTDKAGTRFASMPFFDSEMFFGPMDVDWDELDRESKKLSALITDADELLIRSPNKTELMMDVRGRKSLLDTGILREPGSFSNLPAGEVYLAPVEGKTRGKLVIEWGPTKKLKNSLTLLIEEGFVTHIEGDDEHAAFLEERFKKDRLSRNIAELGIGTNKKAEKPDNILECEKIKGTIHVALGDNSSFGGNIRTSFHLDYVVFSPTVEAYFPGGGKKTFIDRGKWVF